MRAPRFWRQRGILSTALLPASWLYGTGYRLRRLVSRPAPPPVPVICVGNLVAGGAGKTPVVRFVTQFLRSQAIDAVVISRGYGGTLAGPVCVETSHRADEVGDEPLMLHRAGLPVWIARRRPLAIEAAAKAGAEAVILDDGFQNPTFAKTLSLLVVDGDAGFGNDRLLPAGPLRETLRMALRRTDAVILLGGEAGVTLPGFGTCPVFRARLDALPLDAKPERAVAFAGIGRPEKFFSTLRRTGTQTALTVAFPDHHRYTADELARLSIEAASLGATLVTTEKDAVRLPAGHEAEVAVLKVRLAFDNEAAFRGWLLERWASIGA